MSVELETKVFVSKEGKEYTLEPFIPESEIQKRVKEIGHQISEDYKGRKLTLVASLKGGSIFLADLMRNIDHDDLEIEFVEAGSYGNGTEAGELNITRDFNFETLNGRNVIIIEDIADTGKTLAGLIKRAAEDPELDFESLRIATLLSKPSRRQVEVPLHYVGFTIEDKFVVGYGLDYQQKHRHLPDIEVVKFS